MKRKALAIVLTLLMLVSVLPMGAFAASYTDTVGHWAEQSIDQWTEAGVLNGRGNDKYVPDDNLTRAEAMTVFSRLLKLTEKADISKLTDVTVEDWFYTYVQTGYVYDITKGTSDTEFNPEAFITRQEFFTMFARAVGLKAAATPTKDFSDIDTMSDWAKEAGMVYAMINGGYLNGYPDGTLKPLQNITRAEIPALMTQTIGKYITEDGTYDLTGVDGIVIATAPNVKLTGTYDGLIVSSAPNAKLDLSGMNGTPRIHVLQPNTAITGAKPGTEVTTGPVATQPTVNGVKRTNNDDYIVPSAIGGGGGGGGGSSNPGSTTGYTVYIDITPPSGKARTLYTQKYTSDQTADAILKELAGISGGRASANKNTLNNWFNELRKAALDKHYSEGGTTVDIDADGLMKFNGSTEKAFNYITDEVETLYLNRIANIREQFGFTPSDDDNPNAWDKMIVALNPINLFDFDIGEKTVSLLGEDEYYDVLADVVNAYCDFHSYLQSEGYTSQQMKDIFQAFFINVDGKSESVGDMLVDTDGILVNRDYSTNNKYEAFDINMDISDAKALLNSINELTSLQLAPTTYGEDIAKAAIYAIEEAGHKVGEVNVHIYSVKD